MQTTPTAAPGFARAFTAVAVTEWRRLLRSPVRWLSLVLLLAAGGYAIRTGESHVVKWRAALAFADGRERDMQAQALDWYADSATGPADRPWVNIREPLWAEWYTSSWFGMAPTPLAAVSVGLSDVRGHSLRLSRFATPFDVAQMEELGNPEHQRLGTFDLAFVFALLLPLFLIALGHDLGSGERERGVLRMLVVQSGRLAPWYGARLGVLALHALLPTWLLWGVVGVRTSTSASDAMNGALLLTLYVLLWTGLVGTVALRASTSANSALRLVGLWALFALVVPGIGNLVTASRAPIGYSLPVIDALRADRYALYEQSPSSMLTELYRTLPVLRTLPYADRDAAPDSARDELVDRHIVDWIAYQRAEEVAETTRRDELQRHAIGATVQWFSPPVALQYALASLAGTDAQAFVAFSADVSQITRAKLESLLSAAWTQQPMNADSFKAMAAIVPTNREYRRGVPFASGAALLCWSLCIGWLVVAAVRSTELSAH
jgi:ABC-2 type transport system permease protein